MDDRTAFPTLFGLALACLLIASGAVAAQTDADVQSIRDYFKQIEQRADLVAINDLKASAFFVPDALAYNVGKEYLALRDAGKAHFPAIEELKKSRLKWRKLGSQVEIRLILTGSRGNLYTIPASSFPSKLIGLGAGRKRFSFRVSNPRNLKVTSIRVNKYLGSKPDLPEFPNIQDPTMPAVSKPFKVVVFEKPEVEIGLLVRKARLKGVEEIDIGIAQIKRHRGALRDGRIDVNRAPWTYLDGIKGSLRLPEKEVPVPAGLTAVVQALE